MKLRQVLLAAVALLATLGGASVGRGQGKVPAGDENGVPKAFLGRLDRGVNVTRWFCYLEKNASDAHFSGYFTEKDWEAFRANKVTFARLCLSPNVVYRGEGELDEAAAAHVDKALDAFEARGVAVLYDLHDNGQLKLSDAANTGDGFVRFWENAAKRYKGKHEETIAFELLNEPVFKENPEKWYALQARATKAIRAIDPARTIVATSTSWGSIDTLVKMPLLEERNVVYTYHCYDPFYFTHQGASWVNGAVPRDFKAIPFPATAEAVAAILDQNDPKLREQIEAYGKAGYDDAYLKKRLATATEWGAAHHVPLVLGEFGAYPKVSPPDSRERWFAGMRKAIEELHVPAALWGYDDALGLGRKLDGDGLWLDPVVERALYGVGK